MSSNCYIIFCSNQGSALFLGYLNVQPEQSDVLESKPAVLETVYLESEVYVYGEASTSTSDLERRSCQSEIQQSDRYLAMQSDNSDKFTGPESGLETCIALQPKHVNQSERSPKEARVSHSSKRKESKEVFQEKDTANDGIYGSINTAFSNNHEESHSVEVIRTLYQVSEQIKCNGINYEDEEKKKI